jgi:fructosamine-3-kinase
MLPVPVRDRCRELLGRPIRQVTPLGGGDINQARLLETGSGRYFLKMNTLAVSLDMFRTEAAGLKLIRETETIRSPNVLGCEQVGNTAFLLLEFIESGRRSDGFWTNFGVSLAEMHRAPQPAFGLSFDNYIGSLPQANPEMERWPAFYQRARLAPQLQMALDTNRLDSRDRAQFDQLFQKLPDLLPGEPPSLIHGDLWSGNFLAGPNEEGVLIDPAVCRAHREMDIAMSKLFGGFAPAFYEAYHAAYPLLSGWEERVPIYQLYYLLVHVNLFGGGYVGSVREVLRGLV